MLQDKVIGIYCLVDDIPKEIRHIEYKERKVSDSEIISIALISALYYKGNQVHSKLSHHHETILWNEKANTFIFSTPPSRSEGTFRG